MTVRLLTNIGRLWTGSDVCSNAAILLHNDRIAWVGRAADLPQSVPGVVDDIVDVDHVENLGGALVTPGLIDAHSHPVYAGNRWAEMAMRSGGSSYSTITAAGGGIGSTVTVTRGTDPWTLCDSVRKRLREWLLSGTTTVEAKTGYHLTRDGELSDVRMLRELEKEPNMPRIHATFLAAHVVPPEYFGRQRDYVEAVGAWCGDAAAAGADSVDVYCDEGHFTTDEARWVLASGRNVGLLPRIHAGVNSRNGAVQLAAEVGCSSADLLHYTSEEDLAALARYGVPAVICPGTALQHHSRPPVRRMIDAGIPIALGTDHNPGHCGITSMSLVIALAVTAFGMSVAEALRAATLGSASALNAPDRGVLAPGRLADIVQWDADHEGAFAWAFGLKPRRVWRGGQPVQ
ncbi:imidazolonepropionase [Bailinhaonella thermotolerans]|uniref:Imidazolonepropionase n=1 Tax=Bailinhaonella thermotolerans TaxID=1070861 RepID=A0A3A4AB82_9ACTN|nr:imidazolonepropionase [Bailinhaonella thermotolerans]RJL26496.1 imidazolonepropionase [Bailinhaonella thermotolerans]